MIDSTPNPYLDDQEYAEALYGMLVDGTWMLGMLMCADKHLANDHHVAPLTAKHLAYSLALHSDVDDPVDSIRCVVFEIARIVHSNTTPDTRVGVHPDTPEVELGDWMNQLGSAAVTSVIECGVRGDLAAAVKPFDAIVVEFDDNLIGAQNMMFGVIGNLLLSLALASHRSAEIAGGE